MAKRPTIRDVARAAGLSPATVDRVLNGREAVRAETAGRVYRAAREIGYHAAPLIAQRLQPDLPHLRLGVILQKERQPFYQAFRAELERAARAAPGQRITLDLRFAASQSPQELAEHFDALAGRADVVAATAVNHPAVTDAVQRLADRGQPCIALMNDFAQGLRHSYLGLNNMKAGRIAAHMVATAAPRPGKVAVFVGGHRWHGHELRETGFRSCLREHAPEFTTLDTLVNLETRQLTYEATLDLLARHPDLVGLYCAGGGMEGAIAALRESRPPGALAMVVNELTAESRAALVDRRLALVIATPLAQLCDRLMALAAAAHLPGGEGQHFLAPDLHLPESV